MTESSRGVKERTTMLSNLVCVDDTEVLSITRGYADLTPRRARLAPIAMGFTHSREIK